jgi:uncharacterized membrane protein
LTDSRRWWLLLIPVLLLSFWLGARMLNADAIWLDEVLTIYDAGGDIYGPLSPVEIWTRIAEEDPYVPPLHFWLLSAWGWTVGWTAFAIRALSLFIGILAVVWTYRLGREMFSARVGFYAAAVLATSAFFIDYYHEIRAYSLYALVSVFAVWAYWRAVSSPPQTPPRFARRGLEDTALPLSTQWRGGRGVRMYFPLALSFTALAYTHYAALAVAAVLALYHLLFVPKSRRWWYVVIAMGVGALLYLPWLGVNLEALNRGAQDPNRRTISMPNSEILPELLYTYSNGSVAMLLFVAAYSVFASSRNSIDAGMIHHAPTTRASLPLSTLERGPGGEVKSTLLLWLWAVLAIALLLLVNAYLAFLVHSRYTIVVWPALALIVGLGMARLGKAGVRPALILVIWMGVGVWQTFQPEFTLNLWNGVYRTPWPGMARAFDVLKERGQPDDLAILHVAQIGFEELNAYALRYLMHDLPVRFDQFERMNNSPFYDDANYLPDVQAAIDRAPFIWTLVVPELQFRTTNRSAVVQRLLDTDYAACETVLDRPDMQMKLYARQPEGDALATFTVNLGDGGLDPRGHIGLYELTPIPDSIDDALRLILGWNIGEAILPDVYSVALHLDNAAGDLVAQDDYVLPYAPFGCKTSSFALDNLPPGDYALYVVVYEWQTGLRLPGTMSDESGDRLRLKQITKE